MNFRSLKKEANLIPLLAILVTIAIIIGAILTEPKEPETDWKAFDSLMNYIGAKKIAENKVFSNATMGIVNDTVNGLNHTTGNFFVQSLKNPEYYKEITPEKGTPSYLTDYSKKWSIASLPMYFIQHYKNKCLYFGNVESKIDKLCVNGDHESILTYNAMEKSRGGFLHYRTDFIYHEGVIFQGNTSGIYGFKEKTGEIVYHWDHEKNGNYGNSYYFYTLINDVLIIVDYLEKMIQLTAIDVNDFKKLWEREFSYDLRTLNFEHNSENVFALSFREREKSIFLKVNSGETILKTNYLVQESSTSHFKSVTDSSALIHIGDNAYGRLNFWKNELAWKSNIGIFSFPYHNYVISKKRMRWEYPYMKDLKGYFVTDEFYIVDRKTGELLKTINVEGDAPSFVLINQYIRAGDSIYK